MAQQLMSEEAVLLVLRRSDNCRHRVIQKLRSFE